MKCSYVAKLLLMFSSALLLSSACADPGSVAQDGPTFYQAERPTLALVQAAATGDGVTVDLVYDRPPEIAGPRMVELFFKLSDGLKLTGSEPLSAVIAADKQLVVQELDGGVIRTIIFTTDNLNTIAPGLLVRYTFNRSGQVPQTLQVLNDSPVFAPTEAGLGLDMTETLTIGGQ